MKVGQIWRRKRDKKLFMVVSAAADAPYRSGALEALSKDYPESEEYHDDKEGKFEKNFEFVNDDAFNQH
jgi:hypothetical protein